MHRDLLHFTSTVRALSPVSVADNTAQVAQAVDANGYAGVLYTINIGSVADADATFTVLLEESDDNSTWAAVADIDMISQTSGTAPEAAASFQFDSDNTVKVLDYIGFKRYTRMTITPAANASAALFGVTAHKYGARHNPAGATQAP